jgi:hypothetical protein
LNTDRDDVRGDLSATTTGIASRSSDHAAECADWRPVGLSGRDSALRDSLLDLKIAGGRDAAAALFIIDQAEEFLASPETAESFLRTMAGILADRTLRAIAVLTLRSDFFGRFQRLSSAIDLPLETIAVGPMPVQGYHRSSRDPPSAPRFKSSQS